jgi:hypothetical protein
MAYEDYASMLQRAVNDYGKPAPIISDHGSTSHAVESPAKEQGLTAFKKSTSSAKR